MTSSFSVALSCLLGMQVSAQTPLSYPDILARVRPTTQQWRMESQLAEWEVQIQESWGLLRERPILSFQAGPRWTPGSPTAIDKGIDVELPLFLSPSVRSEMVSSLGPAHSLMLESSRREAVLRVKLAYLEAWLAQRILEIRETDLATVERWLEASRSRVTVDSESDYQVSLVEGEMLKAQHELDEARTRVAQSWGELISLADIPGTPVPLAEPGPIQAIPEDDIEARLGQGPMRKALLVQLDVEERSLRLKEAQASSRWSLRGGVAEEDGAKVLRLGVAVALPRAGEGVALQRNTDTQIRVLQEQYRQALAELDARILGVVYRFQKTSAVSPVPDFSRAIEDLGLRLEEGREQPSEAFSIRRQLLEAQVAALRRIQARHMITAEIQFLLP